VFGVKIVFIDDEYDEDFDDDFLEDENESDTYEY
jgi:hypothetical protein